jgi:glycosyltransferase involved in cell wall biosynthesis
MRIVIWHGYLLGGTGSNVYTRSLARSWARQGHDVVVVCQDPHPERHDLGGATVVRPEIGTTLPVFVLDEYEDLQPRLLQDLDRADLDRYVERNAAALRACGPADFVLANHVLLGGPVGAASGLPFAVKAHGSELEFSMRGRPALGAWAADALTSARVVLAGSEHVVRVLREVVGEGSYLSRVRVGPPGVDVEALRPQDRGSALAALLDECRRDSPNPGRRDHRRPDDGNADRLARFFADERPTALYVGKLSEEKGVSLLLEAASRVGARLVVVGFGPARDQLEQVAGPDVLFTGPLEHRHLAHLWPLAAVSVVPSVFPEAFGMVAAEAAACGSPPLVARHSGLAEVAAALEVDYPADLRHLASFETGDVDDLAARLDEVLHLPPDRWSELSRAARAAVERHWSWDHVGDHVVRLMTAGAPRGQ